MVCTRETGCAVIIELAKGPDRLELCRGVNTPSMPTHLAMPIKKPRWREPARFCWSTFRPAILNRDSDEAELRLAAGQLESLFHVGRLDKYGIKVNVVADPITRRINKPEGFYP